MSDHSYASPLIWLRITYGEFEYCIGLKCQRTHLDLEQYAPVPMSWDSSLGIVTRLRAWRLRYEFRQGKRFFSTPLTPDWLWGPPCLLANGYRGLSLQGLCGRDVKLITVLYSLPGWWIVELYCHSPIRLHSIVFNYIIRYSENFNFIFHFLPVILD